MHRISIGDREIRRRMHNGGFHEAASESSKQGPGGRVRRWPEPEESNGTVPGAGLQAETSGRSVIPPDDVADTEDRTKDDVTRGKGTGLTRDGTFEMESERNDSGP